MQGLSVLTDPQGNPKTAMIDLQQYDSQLNPLVAGVLQLLQQQQQAEIERTDFHALSLQGLSRAYGDDEPEYTDADLIWINPDFKPSIGPTP